MDQPAQTTPAATTTTQSEAAPSQPSLSEGLPKTAEEHLRFDVFDYLDKMDKNAPADPQSQVQDTVTGAAGEGEDTLPADAGGDSLQGGTGEADQPPNAPQADPMTSVLEQLAALQAQLQVLQSGRQPPANAGGQPQPAATAQGADQPGAMPNYMLDIPDQIMAGMASEDPAVRKQSVQLLLNGVGRYVHQNLTKVINQTFEQVPALVQQSIREHAAARQIFEDFYGKYKDLNASHLIPVVQQVHAELAQKHGWNGWNAQIRDTLAREVYRRIGRAMPNGGAQPRQPQLPPKQFGGTRPVGPAAPVDKTVDDIVKTFS